MIIRARVCVVERVFARARLLRKVGLVRDGISNNLYVHVQQQQAQVTCNAIQYN